MNEVKVTPENLMGRYLIEVARVGAPYWVAMSSTGDVAEAITQWRSLRSSVVGSVDEIKGARIVDTQDENAVGGHGRVIRSVTTLGLKLQSQSGYHAKSTPPIDQHVHTGFEVGAL